MEKTAKKGGFQTGLGFILAAAGSAVGLGNLWSFPYKTSQNGGAAFVIVYILCTVLFGAIVMISEIWLGKRSQANNVTAFKNTNKNLGFVGLIVLIIPAIILCYYSVLGGWTTRYAMNSFQGVIDANNAHSYASFTSNPYEPVFYTFIFMLLAAIVIAGGVKGGIEKASKVLMPILFIILVFMVIFCLCLGDGVEKGLDFYLNPDFKELGFKGIIAAMSQSFYSLSLGMGCMIAYGSYTGNEIKVGKSVTMICVFDTIFALLAGLAIFPAIGALSPESLGDNAQSVGLIFIILPKIFEAMGSIGPVVSFLFFGMVVIAALTSVISLMEVVTQFVIQKFKLSRKKASLTVCLIGFLISIPIAWSVGGAFDGKITLFGFDLLTFFDEVTNTVLMPLSAFFGCIAVGWIIGNNSLKEKLNPKTTLKILEDEGLNLGKVGMPYAVMVKYVTPLLILFIEVFGIIDKTNFYATKYDLNFMCVVLVAGILLALCLLIYFLFIKNSYTGVNADELE
ncbi:MAG: sodium-dependent transporter [Clostridia bacterium]|nr:sodium-dependent transporter [Clostridia bacterium]